MEPLKFLADPLFPEGIVIAVRRAGFDAVHAAEIGATDLPAAELLRLAMFENRVLLTMNQTLARLATERVPSPSLVVFRQKPGKPEAMAKVLLRLLPLFNEDLAAGAMVVIRDDETLLRKFPRTTG